MTRRKTFLSTMTSLLLAPTCLTLLIDSNPESAHAIFDGGIGGLGKTKPDTGIVYRETYSPTSSSPPPAYTAVYEEAAVAATTGGDIRRGLRKTKPEMGVVHGSSTSSSSSSNIPYTGGGGGGNQEIINEILTPITKQPVLVSFTSPWSVLKSTSGIETRNLNRPESAFVQVAPTSLVSNKGKQRQGGGSAGGENDSLYARTLPKEFFVETIFGKSGKFGAYGTPTDIKIEKISSTSSSNNALYAATFTALTPAMRESERKVYIAVSVVADGVFMLVTGTTMARFKSQEKILREVAESFRAVAAPKSSLRATSSD